MSCPLTRKTTAEAVKPRDYSNWRPVVSRIIPTIGCVAVVVLLNCVAVQAQWRGDGTQRCEAGVPYVPLSTLPELRTDMPLDCMVAYIAMDSIARTLTHADRGYIRSFPLNTSLDTFRVLARFYYAAYDYDPVLLRRYLRHTYDKINDSVHNYTAFPVYLHAGIERASRTRLSQEFCLLIQASIIVKARVVEIRRGEDSTHAAPKSWVNFACEVTDRFKGLKLPENCINESSVSNLSGGDHRQSVVISGDCLVYGHMEGQTAGRLSLIPMSEGTIVEPTVGDEVYLFLMVGIDDNWIRVTPQNTCEESGGVFIVKDGKVQDKGDFWGLGTEPTEADFRANLEQKISEIKSW